MKAALEQLTSFTVESIPTLDVAVEGSLDLFASATLPAVSIPFSKPLVLGSGNAHLTARIVCRDVSAVFGNESNYKDLLQTPEQYDGVIIFSASGSKHAVEMIKEAITKQLPVYMITNNHHSSAAQLLNPRMVLIFPKNREPYTYNTSTYLGPIFATTGESAAVIKTFITEVLSVQPLPNFASYDAVTFIIPANLALAAPMIQTKFDELFGSRLTARVFTDEEIKHAKTVVTNEHELFLSFVSANNYYGDEQNRVSLPLPLHCDYAGIIASTYYVVGKIQQALPAYFTQNIADYCQVATEIFGHEIKPIVE